jgi:hypothetical protein
MQQFPVSREDMIAIPMTVNKLLPFVHAIMRAPADLEFTRHVGRLRVFGRAVTRC